MSTSETLRDIAVSNDVKVKEELGPTLRLASIFALITVAVHVVVNIRAQHIGYGLFIDELYYLICGRNLAWGYVDHPPVVALAARFSELVFGLHSMALFRLLPTLAGALEVAGTGLLVREMGGGLKAQALAMLAVMTCPVVLAIDCFLSMNCFEPLFWMGTAYGVLRAVRAGDPRWWAIAGIAAGLGLENKWNEVFFLFALLGALLLTRERKALANRWFAACIALIMLIALPNLLWELHRGWPTLVWLHNAAAEGKNLVYGPLPFLWNQIFINGPLSSLLWIAGLVWLLIGKSARGLRWIGLAYVLFLAGMMVLHANDYYLAPVYPLLFAAGGVAWDRWLVAQWARKIVVPAFAGLIVIYGFLGIVSVQPVLTPQQYVLHVEHTALRPKEFMTTARSPLPALMANMTGWPELANKLADTYWSLPSADRARAGILVEDYGQASAVNIYRPDVPTAISGHQNYWYWGPRGHDGSVMIVFGLERSTLEHEFSSVTEVGRFIDEWGEPYENGSGPIYLCRGAKEDLRDAWPSLKRWY